jgi:hypothetical protein
MTNEAWDTLLAGRLARSGVGRPQSRADDGPSTEAASY